MKKKMWIAARSMCCVQGEKRMKISHSRNGDWSELRAPGPAQA